MKTPVENLALAGYLRLDLPRLAPPHHVVIGNLRLQDKRLVGGEAGADLEGARRALGDLDIEHTGFYERLMNRLDDEDDRRAVIHAAKRFYTLYGNVFRTLRDGRDAAPRDVVQEAA